MLAAVVFNGERQRENIVQASENVKKEASRAEKRPGVERRSGEGDDELMRTIEQTE